MRLWSMMRQKLARISPAEICSSASLKSFQHAFSLSSISDETRLSIWIRSDASIYSLTNVYKTR